MMSEIQHLYSLATATFVVTSLVVAAVRWFHMCPPYDKNPDYNYPGRPYVVAAHLMALVLLPYVLNPASSDAFLVMKALYLPFDMFFLALLMFGYFGNVMHWNKWKRPTLFIGIPILLLLLALLVLAIVPGEQTADPTVALVVNGIIYGVGALMTAFCFVSVRRIYQWIKNVDTDEYSNAEDFPTLFARKMIALLMLTVILLWATAIAGNPTFYAILQLVLTVLAVLFLIYTLPPQRQGTVSPEVEAEQEAEKTPKQIYVRQIPESRVLEILSGIAEVVLERKAFLNPHLTIQDVADRCGYNRTYVAGVFKTELGGFFNYINTQRLEYAEKYMQEHPKASIQEVATESGFSSRQTYYSVKSKLRKEE